MRKLILFAFLIACLGVGTLPVGAQCTVTGTAPNQTYDCMGPLGINVGDGNDTVNIIGHVAGTIQSDSGTLLVIVVGPGGELNVAAGDAIRVNGSGNVTSMGDIQASWNGIVIFGNGDVISSGDVGAGWAGILIFGNGDVTSSGDMTAAGSGIYVSGSGDVANMGNITVGGDGIVIISGGNVTSTGNITAVHSGILVWDSGDVTSVGDIDAGRFAIWLGDGGNVSSTGDIDAVWTGIYTESGNVSNNGDIIAEQYDGILIGGSGDAISSGRITAGGSGIVIGHSGNVSNNGDITAGWYGIYITGSGNVMSEGDIKAGLTGIYTRSGNITSTGNIKAGWDGIYIADSGNVSSAGDIRAGGYGIYIRGGNATSDGDIKAARHGIYVIGSGHITSNGNISAGWNGIELGDKGTIDVTGSIHGDNIGIVGGAGDQLLVINAVVSGGSGTAIDTRDGDDWVYLGATADIRGDIRMGSGDDTVQIVRGARVHGVIDGGTGGETDGDLLLVGDLTFCADVPGGQDGFMQQWAEVTSNMLESGVVMVGGISYTVVNFERLASGVRLELCYHPIDDGRINRYDIGAWVAGYCNVEDGVNLWAIADDGSGQADVSANGAAMRAALEQAVTGGMNVQVAAGPRGTSLWALASNEYQFMGPDARQPGQNYVYIFQPGTCGMGNALG